VTPDSARGELAEEMPEVMRKESQRPRIRSPLLKQRDAQGLSREELARRAGLSPRTIYAIELEGVHPQRATKYVLAQALGIEPDALEPQNDERQPTPAGVVQESGRQARPNGA
jgi:transcriptional regulator with XRE-family HTH domain